MISLNTNLEKLRKGLTLFLFLLCISYNCLAQPAITAFTPASGPVGTAVTITGANFSATPSNNTVFVGGVKANVTSAASGSLTITVPAGAQFQPITVTTNGLTTFSKNPFVVTFAGAAPQFTARSFDYAGRIDSVDASIETTNHAVGDFDDDKKIDIVTVNRLNNTISVYRNTTTGGVISFAPKTDYSTGQYPRNVTVADIDGDGKPDVIVSNTNDYTVSVFRNISVSGAISFAPKVDFTTEQDPAGIAVADIDNDGKPDLVIRTLKLETTVSVLRNTSSEGTISFANKFDFYTLAGLSDDIRTADVDGDGKTDILLPDFNFGQIQIYRNTSSTGSFSFAAKQTFATSASPYHLEVGDLNSDGKPDLFVSYSYGTTISVLTNASSSGSVAFSNTVNYSFSDFTAGIAINDLDGDGKPDLAVGVGSDSIALFKNTGTAGGVIAFNSNAKFGVPFNDIIATADFDNDGKADLAPQSGVFRVSIWKNRTASPQVLSFSPNTAGAGATITITGVHFTGANAVLFGGVPAASFTVVNDNMITATVGAGVSGAVTVKTVQDFGRADGFVFTAPPVITGFTPASASNGETVTITGNYFMGTTVVSFGGTAVASFTVKDDDTIIAVVGNGTSGQVSVTTQYGTASAPGFSYTPIPNISSFSPTTGGAGTTVAINGTNLSGATAVSFGGVPARSFTIMSSSLINAVVDAGASGTIAVVTPFGTATKVGFTFRPAPVITGFSPASATTGDAVTITGSNFSNVNNVQFGGVPATSFSIQNSTTIVAYVGAGITGDVTVLSPYGNATLPGFTYKPRPVITSFSPVAGTIGTTVTIIGAHFTNTQKVYFGGVEAASFSVVSDNTLMVVTGIGADGPITVINDAGSGFTSDYFSFQYAVPVITSFTPTSGALGTQITIKGRNFLKGLTSVDFGGKSATNVVVTTDTTITATVGAGNSGDVSVRTPGGEAALPGFTFIQAPPPVTAFSPSHAVEGMAVGITGSRFTGATAVTFGGVPATSFTVNSDTRITAVVGAGASGDVAVTTPDGTGKKSGFVFGGVVISSFSPATGAPGTVVTITGSGFVNVSSVLFGKVAASSFKVNSPASITATVPTGGLGLVTITTHDGYSGVSDAFIYQSSVTSIASVSPMVGGAGTTISINGAGFTQATAVTFGGVPAASFTVNSPTSITATVAGGSSGDVAVTSSLGTAVYSGFSYTSAPVIADFAPEAALSGTTITLTGANFNPSAAANIVYFGGLKAEVVSASDKSLTVKVPAGAPYSYISVTNNNLTGYSQKKFNTLFIAAAPLSASSFEGKIDSAWGTSPRHVNTADFDLDGKPDVAVCHASGYINADHIALFKNNSVAGKLSFLPKVLINSNHGPLSSATGDLDGDGKLDLMVANAMDGQNLSVYRNTSTGNSISFDNELYYPNTGPDANYVACADFDADGKPDIFIVSAYGGAYVYRNTSTVGSLSFVKMAITVPNYIYGVTVADMDLDGKTDLVMLAHSVSSPSLGVTFRNISTPGNIAFETPQPFQTGPDPRYLTVADLDGDGKMDILLPGGNGQNNISIVHNLSVPGRIVMDNRRDLMTAHTPYSLAVGDMNGDGKPDILASFDDASKISIYPSTGSPGNFSFGQPIELNTTATINSICIADLDSDTRPDIIVSNEEAGSISLFRNKLNALLLTSFTPADGATGTVVTIKGENLTNATAVTIGRVPVSSFTVVDANTITAVVGAGKSGDVSVTTPLGTVKLSGFVYLAPPTITSFTPTTSGTGTAVTIKGANFTGSTSVSFGGVSARSFIVNSDSVITAIVGQGASGVVAVTTPLGTGTRDGFIYDALTAIVDPGSVNSAALTVQPNPTHDVLIIKHPASVKKAYLRFVDITGQTVKIVVPALGATQTSTNVVGLMAGVYTIVYSEGSRTLSRVIVVQ